MAQSFAEFGDLDIQQSGGQEEAEFGALELQQAQVLFSALNTLRQGQPPLAWDSEAAAEIEVSCATFNVAAIRMHWPHTCDALAYLHSFTTGQSLQDIKERTSQAATATDDPIARR